MTLLTRRSGPLTRDDLDALPDDGRRHELIDGVLVVTPAPLLRHQTMVGHLYVLLVGACPPDLKVLLAPFDVALGGATVLQPDILVARRSDLTERDLPTVPVLAIEVLSPSTRHIDLSLKRARYEEAGCPAYWVLDPAVPSLRVWQLDVGAYGDPTIVTASEEYAASAPFPVTVIPAELLD